MDKDREIKFGEGGSPAEVAMQQAKKAASDLREQASLDSKRAQEIGGDEHPTGTQYNAMSLAQQEAANSIESAIDKLSGDVEEVLKWPYSTKPQS